MYCAKIEVVNKKIPALNAMIRSRVVSVVVLHNGLNRHMRNKHMYACMSELMVDHSFVASCDLYTHDIDNNM